MDTEIIKELLSQYGLTAAVLAFIVSIVVSGVIGAGFFFVNQRIQRHNEEYLERLKTTWVKELEMYKATIVKEAENIQQARWNIKYQACLDALDITDVFLSHYFEDVNKVKPVRARADTIQARKCQNRLAITCENPAVVENFTDIMFPKRFEVKEIIDNINALRNVIRTELGFGDPVQLNEENAWIVRLKGDKREDDGETL